MKILGISLTTPRWADLLPVANVALVAYIVSAGLAALEVWDWRQALALTAGAAGGSLASAYGVSVARHGVRGAALCMGFSMGCMGLAIALLHLTTGTTY